MKTLIGDFPDYYSRMRYKEPPTGSARYRPKRSEKIKNKRRRKRK